MPDKSLEEWESIQSNALQLEYTGYYTAKEAIRAVVDDLKHPVTINDIFPEFGENK